MTLHSLPLHSFHLAEVSPTTTLRAFRPAATRGIDGLEVAETFTTMRLGAPTISPDRLQLRHLALFAQWRDEQALDSFLTQHPLGRELATGWHVRMTFLRQWGHLAVLDDRLPPGGKSSPDEPVVAVTIARMRLLELPRFLRWGKPVERLVRDHPGTTLSLAANRPPHTICTFSVWKTQRDMVEMVHGHSRVDQPTRHIDAMGERDRRDFHHEFTTLRFRPLGEHGIWQGSSGLIPGLAD